MFKYPYMSGEGGQTPEGLTPQPKDATPKKSGGLLSIFGRFRDTPASNSETPIPTQTGVDTQKRIDHLSTISGYRGDGSPRMTPPTAEGLAQAQEAAPPTPPTGSNQGK